MQAKIFKVISLVSVLVLAFALSACSGSEAPKEDAAADAALTLVNEGQFTVTSDYQFPPFEYMEGNEKAGFSIELVTALAEEMGLEANWSDPVKFDALVPLVKQGGTIDAAVASITINEERKQEVDFSDPYLDSNQGLAVMKDSQFASQEDLNKEGVKVAVQSGSTGEAWASENLTNATIVVLDDNTAGFAAMQAGQADAVALDLPVMQWMINDAYPDAKVISEIPTGEQYGIAISKDNPELTKKVNEALAALKANGKYDEIVAKYFG